MWWIVKVYDAESGTTTTLNRYATCVEEIEEDLAEDGYWIFVNAVPEDDA